MNDIEALLIHNKVDDNVFPSIGIFDEKISLDDNTDKAGIKLSGYVENINDIEFKLFIKYKNEENIEKKYYYVDKISTNN